MLVAQFYVPEGNWIIIIISSQLPWLLITCHVHEQKMQTYLPMVCKPKGVPFPMKFLVYTYNIGDGQIILHCPAEPLSATYPIRMQWNVKYIIMLCG